MNLVGFLVIFLCLFVGQMIVQFFNLPLPPSIIGLILLFLLLQFKIVPLKAVQPISAVLLGYLVFLVVPATISVMLYLNVVKQDWFALTAGTALSTLLVLLSVGLSHKLVLTLVKRTKDES